MRFSVGCSRFWIGDRHHANPRHVIRLVAACGAAFLIVILVLFTWFGQDWRGVSQLLHAMPRVLTRAGGEGHQKPFWYYARLLCSGHSGLPLSCLASAGAVIALRHRVNVGCFVLACYAIIIMSLYTAIPYKTPWLALNLWVPLALLTGVALECGFRRGWAGRYRRITIPSVMVASTLFAFAIGADTWKRVYLHPADERNPYAYAHTSEDLVDLPAAIVRLAQERGLASPRIAVVASDPWPLPWYLRHFSRTGYWQPGQDPGGADFYITSTEAAEQMQAKLQDLRPEFFGVRPGVLVLVWSRDREQP